MKQIIIFTICIASAFFTFNTNAAPHYHHYVRPAVRHHPRPIHRHHPRPIARHHHHHPRRPPIALPFVTGLVGGYIASTIINQPTKTVVVSTSQPVVVSPAYVWVEGHYEDRVQSNGTVIRVWVPGQYVKR